jgi:DNA-binding NtrC family response regulator
MNRTNILIIADELAVVQSCSRVFNRAGHHVETALRPGEATFRLAGPEYDVIFMDVKLAWGEGVNLLHQIRESQPETSVVLMLGLAPIASAVETMRYGGYDYLPKPFTPEAVTAALVRALQRRTMMLQARQVRENEVAMEFGELIGTGPAMRELFQLITRVAPTGDSVLIVGELGTGKELAARAIHRASPRASDPFIRVDVDVGNQVSIAEQLFGRINSQNGSNLTPGRIEEASIGTLYLDEIGALNLDDQEKLFNAIRERHYLPVRGRKPRPLACRVILATAHDLQKAREEGLFSEKLYYQLPVLPIYLPTLAERTEDVPALAYHFLRRYALRYGREKVTRVDERLMTRLISHHWDGNVRELAACVERMVSICEGETLEMQHYQEAMEEGGDERWLYHPPTTAQELTTVKKQLRRAAVTELERSFVTKALQRAGGNVTLAAKQTGMQRRNFQSMMRQYGVKAG